MHKHIPEILAYINLKDPDPKKQVLIRRDACKLLISMSNHAINTLIKNDTVEGNLIPIKKSKEKATYLSHVECSLWRNDKEKIL